jgi:flagellar FliL protein
MAEQAEAQGSNSTKLVLMMIIGAVVLVAVSMGGIFFLLKSMGMLNQGGGQQQQMVDKNAPAIYFPLEPAFVVNFNERGRNRYLQVGVEIMARDPAAVAEIEKHLPVIRNNLLLLFGSQDAETLRSPEGKEKIREEALTEIKRIIQTEAGKVSEAIEQVLFTTFVMQ